MPFLADPFTVLTSFDAGFTHAAALRAAPPARADGSIAHDAEHVRSKARIEAVDAHRPDCDAVPEHDPDGTPWAA